MLCRSGAHWVLSRYKWRVVGNRVELCDSGDAYTALIIDVYGEFGSVDERGDYAERMSKKRAGPEDEFGSVCELNSCGSGNSARWTIG